MSRLLPPVSRGNTGPKESMMVVWSDGKPMTVLKAKGQSDSVEGDPRGSLPFQYTIPLSKYNTLACAANKKRRPPPNDHQLPEVTSLPRVPPDVQPRLYAPQRHPLPQQQLPPQQQFSQQQRIPLGANPDAAAAALIQRSLSQGQRPYEPDSQRPGRAYHMVPNGRQRLPDSLPADRLEKEYNALKTKEQEEQVELRRLRTENRLLRQRIDNLEKETGTLADRLIQDQVKYAQQEEELYVLRRDVKAARQQSREANDRVAEVTTQYEELQGKANGSGESPEEAHSKDEQILELRHELRESRYQESESKAAQGELRGKIRELENMVRQLEKEPSAEMQHLQEELIACKLREAEANLSLKELQQKVNELDRHWQKHVEKLQTPPSGSTSKPSKERLQHYENELMTVRIREASAISELKEVKLRLMELETENHICGRQIKRLEDENTRVKEDLETRQSKEREKEHQAKEVERRISDIESKRREDVMMVKIKDAEYAQSIAEMRRRIAELEIENQELITAGQLQERGDRQDLEQRVSDLLEEVQQLKMARRLQSLSSLALNNINLDTESDYDTDELEASRLKLPEGVSLNTGNGLPRPMLPELNIDTSSCSDSDDYPIHSSESAPGRADRKQGAAMLDAHRGGGKGRVTAHARRKKRASLMKDHRVTSEIDYDRTPTQDSVNNGIFVLGNGVEATTLASNGIDSGSRSGSGSGSGSAEPPADETSTSVMADDNTAGRPNPTT